MISLKKFNFSPHSLRQLVLLAFLLALCPLLVLAYQAYQSLNNLSEQASEVNRTTLADVRRSEAMVSLAVEMERSYRQYCVLDDVRLANLYKSQRSHYRQLLENHATILPEPRFYQRLDTLMKKLTQLQCQNNRPITEVSSSLAAFSVANGQMAQATRNTVFTHGQQLQQAISEQGRFFGWQSLMLLLVSLLLVFLFTRLIIGPVKRVERMINRLGEGKNVGTIARFHGPKEIQALAQRLMWLSERLAWLESQRHEFLRHISHELKTPLASMREGTALLIDEIMGTLTQDQKEIVSILDNSSLHLQQLIEQLLDYNRKQIDAPVEKADVILNTLVQTVIMANQLPARAKAIQTLCDLDVLHCWTEPTLLERVLDNLYSNAVHYGAEFGTIWIRSRRVANTLQIDIANTGTPISEAEKKMIFEPFFQGNRQRKGSVKGSGLGLSIARDCAHRMQGELQLVKVKDADVCFRVELPLEKKIV